MKFYIKIIKTYLNILSYIAPNYGGKVAIKIFSKVRIKKIKEKEKPFFEKAKHFIVKRDGEDLDCYEMGNPNGKLVFLVHGWESNAGSLSQFANILENDYRIISFNNPGHAGYKENSTNLYEGKKSFKLVLEHVNPTEPFFVISHSFGSAITSYALSEVDYKADKLIFLSTNNEMQQVFLDFKNMLGFNVRIYEEMNTIARTILGEDLAKIVISEKLKFANFNELLLIHDEKDKVIPFSCSQEIHKEIPNSILKSFHKIGHYRMLWNEEVIQETIDFIKK